MLFKARFHTGIRDGSIRETPPFKADVRKLKRLGLTVSHDTGYELSPRGRALLRSTAFTP